MLTKACVFWGRSVPLGFLGGSWNGKTSVVVEKGVQCGACGREKEENQAAPARPKMFSEGVFRIFGLTGYCGVNDRFSNDLPLTPVALARFLGDEPAVPFQNLGRVVSVLSFSGGAGSEHQNLCRADGWLVPALEPIEQSLGVIRLFGLLFDWLWPSPAQPFK